MRLAVFAQGDPANPTILLVHGYPDTHSLWARVADRLAGSFHVVAYDTRGSGESDAPRKTSAYTTDLLGEDLFAVADAVSPSRPVHVVAHDWGSIQAWEAVTDPRAPGRIASFTSLSGPCLDHVGHWLRRRMAAPRPGNLRALAGQLAHSWYIYLFHLPLLPGLAWRLGIGSRWGALLHRTEGIEPSPGYPAPTIAADGARGVRLYRANMLPRLLRPRHRPAEVPVQVIQPTRDRYVGAALADDLARWVPRLWRREVVAGHWAPLSRPDAVARMVEEFAEHVGGAPTTRGLQRAEVGENEGFAHRLVVLTGASGDLGTAAARAFAALGAEVVVADADHAAVRAAARWIGPAAYPHQVDVTDAAAVARFADDVAAEHGVPDVVVHLGGTGSGPWRRSAERSLFGTVHAGRSFGALMAEAGEGGRVVAVVPRGVEGDAVVALADGLRAELADAGVSVDAVAVHGCTPEQAAQEIVRAAARSGGTRQRRRRR